MRQYLKRLNQKVEYAFISGLLVIIPLAFTIWFIKFIIQMYHRIFKPLINLAARWFYMPVPDILIPFIGTLLALLLIVLAGLLVQNIIGKKLVKSWELLLQKVPLLHSVYNIIKQLTSTLLSSEKKGFKSVCLLDWTGHEAYIFGFITAEPGLTMPMSTPRKTVNVFVPTTPNPTSGFFLVVPETKIIRVDISVEDAIKLIMSGGMVSSLPVTGSPASFEPVE